MLIFNSCETVNYPSNRSVYPNNSSIANASNEFEALMIKDKLDKNQRSAAVVSQLINDQPTDKVAALVFENNTNCNIIVRISGAKNYRLPIFKSSRNFLIIDKGSYAFTSNFCNSTYNSRKNIVESVTITLSER
jgi:hypothetical protein